MSKLAANVTLVLSLAAALLALLPTLGVPVSKEQSDAILGVIAALLALLGVWFHPSVPIGPRAEKPKSGP
jgi:uncharacterized membrane protein